MSVLSVMCYLLLNTSFIEQAWLCVNPFFGLSTKRRSQLQDITTGVYRRAAETLMQQGLQGHTQDRSSVDTRPILRKYIPKSKTDLA